MEETTKNEGKVAWARVSHIHYRVIGVKARINLRVEEIVKFRRVVGSDWLEYIYNV